MILEIGPEGQKQKWHLHFHRQLAESDQERAKRGLAPLPWDVVTTCLVHTGICVLTHAEPRYCINGLVGTSKCSKKDQFLRALGSKQALARALRSFDPALREQIWQAYWQKVRRPKERSEHFQRRVGLQGLK
jgi:hypothetical protein